MGNENETFVKTVYDSCYMREPNISKYNTEKEADLMINATLEWGIGIISCQRITKKEALDYGLKRNANTYVTMAEAETYMESLRAEWTAEDETILWMTKNEAI